MMQCSSHIPGRTRLSDGSGSFHGIKSPDRVKKAKSVLKRESILGVKRKSEWPELVGMDGLEARARIREEIPTVQANVVRQDDLITEEYHPGRVQIFVDDNSIVTWPPQIG